MMSSRGVPRDQRPSHVEILVDGRVLDGWGRDRARTSVVSRDSVAEPRDSL
jgi:hypothetical protein